MDDPWGSPWADESPRPLPKLDKLESKESVTAENALGVSQGAIGVRFDVARFSPNRLRKVGDGLVMGLCQRVGQAAAPIGRGVLRPQRQRLRIVGDGMVEIALPSTSGFTSVRRPSRIKAWTTRG